MFGFPHHNKDLTTDLGQVADDVELPRAGLVLSVSDEDELPDLEILFLCRFSRFALESSLIA